MSLFKRLFNAVKSNSVSASDWDEIRSNLIESDLGVKLVDEVIAIAQKSKPDDAQVAISEVIKGWLSSKSREIKFEANTLNTILLVGVNGTGKTTTTAKIAKYLKGKNLQITLAAADTFRAAATEQLQTWGERLNIPVVAGKPNTDPAAVAFEAVSEGVKSKSDYLIVDTAGRLHTKQGLMDELGKVVRVIEKQSKIAEILLVVDATTGQNGITQAKTFIDAIGVTGFVISKLDGSAKGGVAIAIEKETGLPIKFIGTGERADDLAPFDAASYLDSLFK
jgi:fused signal recognition particle receptor